VTRATARTTANLIIATAGVAAVYMVLRTPRLRRLAFRAARIWLGASIPAYLVGETRRAWVESGRAA